MFLFENKAKKIDLDIFHSSFKINLKENPYTLESLKEDYSHFPKQYFSGWQNAQKTIFSDYEAGECNLASTNYMTSLVTRSSQQAQNASNILEEKFGFPVRTLISSFIAKPPLTRDYHYDYYDGVLFNFSGTKVVSVHAPINLFPEEIYRYSNKKEDHENPGTPAEQFILNAGDALYIPAFAHHLVENVGEDETAACSFVFDTSALLIDIFRNTLELCQGELRTPYQARSMCGPRIYWNKTRWLQWTEELKNNKNSELSIFPLIVKELTLEFPELGKQLCSNPLVLKSLREEWVMFIFQFERIRYQKLINH
jgi:hypothetical protein